MWGYPLWSFLPLAAILWFGPVTDALRLRVFAIGVVFLFLLAPAIYIGTYIAEPAFARAAEGDRIPRPRHGRTMTRDGATKPERNCITSPERNLPSTMSRSIRPIGRMSSCMAGRKSVPGST